MDYQWIMKQLPCLVAGVPSGLIVTKVCSSLTKGFLYMIVLYSLQFHSYGAVIVFVLVPHVGQQSFPSFSAVIVQQNCRFLMQPLFQIYWIWINITAIWFV